MGDIEDEFEDLRRGYARDLPAKVARIEDAWSHVVAAGTGGETLDTLRRMVHSLVGGAGSFGLPAVTERARALEVAVDALVKRGDAPVGPAAARIEEALEALRAAAPRPAAAPRFPGAAPVPVPAAAPAAGAPPPAGAPVPPRESAAPPADAEPDVPHRSVFLLGEDAALFPDLAAHLGRFGYAVRSFTRPDQLRRAALQGPPAAVIMDLRYAQGTGAGDTAIEDMLQAREQPFPLVVVSARDDLEARLLAVRAGGKAYFTVPIDFGDLVGKLDQLTGQVAPEPFRILIVEDSVDQSQTYAEILRQAGMLAAVVNDPLRILEQLVELKPELILMDVHMPRCNGIELAAVLRQQDAFVGMPIVFLSGERDVDRRLAAMCLGGDDFLSKPIDPVPLISSVSSRAQRSREMRSFMVRDSLTGLLNHTHLKERLAEEILRAQRTGAPLAFAMIDLDHFKRVNDTYGHANGDRVLRGLSRFLQQRLRRTDLVGRYGGEEFGAILPDCTGASAVKVLERIRQQFAEVRQRAGDREFVVTFSCGVAEFPRSADAAGLCDAADRALYQAKRDGRNRVAQEGGR